MLTPRQRNQIRAALTFWNAVAETSRVHPMEHPKVRSYFEDGKSTPLIAGEIEDLLNIFKIGSDYERKVVTIRWMVRSLDQSGLTVPRLTLQVRRDGIKSADFGGCSTRLYNPSDLIQCARKIAERDAQMERKYRVAPKKSPATDGDKSV